MESAVAPNLELVPLARSGDGLIGLILLTASSEMQQYRDKFECTLHFAGSDWTHGSHLEDISILVHLPDSLEALR